MKRKDIIFYSVVIFVLNLPMLFGRSTDSLVFLGEKVLEGEIYRLFTHAFVHVSWYHLLLDGIAFLMLYSQLNAKMLWQRSCYVIAAAAGTLTAVSIALPYSSSFGYCGLSGIAHGLMTICGLEMLFGSGSNKSERISGGLYISIVALKSIFEAITGHMFLEFLHFSMMGSPVAVSHLGGVIGGAATFLTIQSLQNNVHKMHTPCSPKASKLNSHFQP